MRANARARRSAIVESSSSRNAQKAGGSAQGSDADLCISGTLSRRAGELRVFSKAALMSRRPHWLCGCNHRGRCSLAACRKRPFTTHADRVGRLGSHFSGRSAGATLWGCSRRFIPRTRRTGSWRWLVLSCSGTVVSDSFSTIIHTLFSRWCWCRRVRAWFNGGLFDDGAALPLEAADIETVLAASDLDWSEIRWPSRSAGLAPVATRQRTNPATSPYTFSVAFSSTAPPSELVCG